MLINYDRSSGVIVRELSGIVPYIIEWRTDYMIGEIEQTILNMMNKFETNFVSGFLSKNYVVNDPEHMLKKHLFSMTSEMRFNFPDAKKSSSIIRIKHLKFHIYDEKRMYDLCRERSDLGKELAVVGYLHSLKDLTLTFKNLSLPEPFCIRTKESENNITCKFVNCIFDKSDFENGDVIGGVEVEGCITRNENEE